MHIAQSTIILQQMKIIDKKEEIEDAIASAILDHSDVGAQYVFSTGSGEGAREMYLAKETQDNMANAQVTASGGDVKLKLQGKFPGCKGAVKMQVCISCP